MAKFNVVQKNRRAVVSQRKRAQHGDPATRKLKCKPVNSIPISSKRKNKLFKKSLKVHTDALRKGLDMMQVEASTTGEEGGSKEVNKMSKKWHLKRNLKIGALKHMGKKNEIKSMPSDISVEAMVE